MKKEKTEELFVKWIDGELSSQEEGELASLFQADPCLEVELKKMKSLSEIISAEIRPSVAPPYGDFFNSQLMRKVDLEIESVITAKEVERWWESFRWAWAPVGALALVLSFFAGHRIARPIDDPIAQVPEKIYGAELLPTVYFTGDSLDAEVIADSNGDVSAIVINGLSAIRDDIDFTTVSTSIELPKSYPRAEARRFD